MKICSKHWEMCRSAIEMNGMSGLIAKDGETAMSDMIADLNKEPDDKHERFDPLMSMRWHWTNSALKNGGLYLMFENEDGSNDGQYCPLCEYQKHQEGFEVCSAINMVAEQMAAWCRDEGLIPKVN